MWRPFAIAALFLPVALVLAWAFSRTQGTADRPAERTPAAASSAADPQAASPTPAVEPSDSHPVRIDLTTLRRVWLRVVVDGRIAVEREAGAGERLAFGADRSIVVRAGDAGAVMVRAGREEQRALGRDGQVLTRTFPAPPR